MRAATRAVLNRTKARLNGTVAGEVKANPLCNLCKRLDFAQIRKANGTKPHHADFHSLDLAAQHGCKLCALFRRAVLDAYMWRLKLNEAQAIQHHETLDANEELCFTYRVAFQVLDDRFGAKTLAYDGLYYERRNSGHSRIDSIEVRLALSSSSGATEEIAGRLVATYPSMQLCTAWIAECSSSHELCKPIRDRILPTRLVDVGIEGKREPRLVETAGQSGRYVTLSHCWGNSKPIVTDEHTYAQHLASIPFSTMPRTFQDAITVVRALGYRYLWIDCYCIIQGSRLDWEHECAHMDSIFEQAAFTICGPNAGSTTAGFLHERPPPRVPACALKLKSTLRTTTDTLTVSLMDTQDLPKKDREEAPLAERAWIAQERLLSPRILYFANSQLYFECMTGDFFESYWRPVASSASMIGTGALIRKGMLVHDDKTNLVDNIWRRVATNYAACQLTSRDDMLPALSGLARRYATFKDDEYFGGVWRKSMIGDLSWYRREPLATMIRHTRTYTAPSWSWASQPNGIAFEVDGEGRADFSADARLKHVDTTRSGEDAFGAVTWGVLALEARTQDFGIGQPVPEDHAGAASGAFFLRRLPLDMNENLVFRPDHGYVPLLPGRSQITCLCLGAREYLGAHFSDKRQRWVAIAIQRFRNGNSFQRIGLVAQVRRQGVSNTSFHEDWHNVEKRHVTLV